MFTPFKLALSFLTCLPVNPGDELSETDFRRSFIYFPVIGLGIGLFANAVIDITRGVVQDTGIVAILAVASFAIATRGLHIDGLADTVDGFYGGRDREGRLEIMKDPNTGSFGIAAIVLLLVAQYAAVIVILNERSYEIIPVAFAFSRLSMVLLSYRAEYPREKGTAKPFVGNITANEVISSTLIAVAAGGYLVGNAVAVFLMLAIAVAVGVRIISYQKIGGITGDVLGAGGEISLALLLMFTPFF